MSRYFSIVGVIAGNRIHVMEACFLGCSITVSAEPDNPHDPNALAVHVGRDIVEATKLGYLPRSVAERFRTADGKPVHGTVAHIRYGPELDDNGEPNEHAGKPVGCDIRLEDGSLVPDVKPKVI